MVATRAGFPGRHWNDFTQHSQANRVSYLLGGGRALHIRRLRPTGDRLLNCRQDAVVRSVIARIAVPEKIKHHRPGPYGGDRIGDIFTVDIRR